MAVDITRALSIDGWMSPEELLWLAEEATKHRVIVEVGAYLGRTTVALADHVREGGIVYSYDDWYGPRDTGVTDREGIFGRWMQHTSECRSLPVAMTGDHRAPETPPRVPDLVFIDGSHEYEDVVRDITFWRAQLREGGILAGHDVDWPGVARALDTVFTHDRVLKDVCLPAGALWAWEKGW